MACPAAARQRVTVKANGSWLRALELMIGDGSRFYGAFLSNRNGGKLGMSLFNNAEKVSLQEGCVITL
jgi:hypothetical protein